MMHERKGSVDPPVRAGPATMRPRRRETAQHPLLQLQRTLGNQMFLRLLASSAKPAPDPRASVWDVVRSPGEPLDMTTRRFMEARFGLDLSGVRVHTGRPAADSAHAVSALAYTVGPHIVFGEDRYRPHTSGGKELIAHELVHTIQQRAAMPPAGAALEIDPSGAEEREAGRVAGAVMNGPPVPALQRGRAAIARQQPGPVQGTSDAFAGESPELRATRLNLIERLRLVTQLLVRITSKGILVPQEKKVAGGVRLVDAGGDQSMDERASRLREFVVDLWDIQHKLERAAVGPASLAPSRKFGILPEGGGWDNLTNSVAMLYLRFAEDAGRDLDRAYRNTNYLAAAQEVAEAARPTDIDIIVPDPETHPDDYVLASSPYATWGAPPRGVFQDVTGFFYWLDKPGEQRWYLDAETEDEITSKGGPSWQWEAQAPPGPPMR